MSLIAQIKVALRSMVRDGEVLQRSGNGFTSVDPSSFGGAAPSDNFTPATDGALDLGGAAKHWRTLYLGTSLVTPSLGPSPTQQHTLPAVPSDTVVLRTAAQTLTNKTLTSPTIRGGSIEGVFLRTGSGGDGIWVDGLGVGFFGATPAAQPSAVADATDAASAVTQLNALLARLRTLGLIAT